MQQQADEDELGLCPETLAALKEFALENNMLGPEGVEGENNTDVRLQVQECMDVKERSHDFRFTFGGDSDGGQQVSISLVGVNPELGQTLASTGLTVWRAAQEMARFMWEHRRWFVGKRVVELGAGLGLCGVLASKLCVGGTVVITDGGEEFTDSAMDALRQNLETNSCNPSYTSPVDRGSEETDDAPSADPTPAATAAGAVAGGAGAEVDGGSAKVVLEKLTWGQHAGFLERYGSGGCGTVEGREGEERRGGFDFIVAADVIYEEEAVSPLLHTVVDILNLREQGFAREAAKGQQQHQQRSQGLEGPDPGSVGCCTGSPPPAKSTFLLAFARRNISIDRVLGEAEALGLAWALPDDFEPTSASENIYLMSLR